MPKKFKRITYEKDNDDHFVVVLNPWANGFDKPRRQTKVDWIGAWLRIAFRNPTESNVVKNIYTMDTRDEIIAQISPSVDIELGLGLHKWRNFMEREHMDKIKRQSGGRIDLTDMVSHIFVYNWSTNGDPTEHQWKQWFPRQDDIPYNIMVKRQYPDPEWSEIPPVDARLQSLLIPMPRMPEISYNRIPNAMTGRVTEPSERGSELPYVVPLNQSHEEERKPSRIDIRAESHQDGPRDPRAAPTASVPATAFAPYRPPMHLQARPTQSRPEHSSSNNGSTFMSGKVDKLDPYEEDEAARATLDPSSVKQEVVDVVSGESRVVKAEPEDIKPDVRHAEYRPSNALASAISQLQGDAGSPESEDRKPEVKNEDYTPTNALLDAVAQYPAFSQCNADKDYSSKRGLEDGRDEDNPELRTLKRIKVEVTTAS